MIIFGARHQTGKIVLLLRSRLPHRIVQGAFDRYLETGLGRWFFLENRFVLLDHRQNGVFNEQRVDLFVEGPEIARHDFVQNLVDAFDDTAIGLEPFEAVGQGITENAGSDRN